MKDFHLDDLSNMHCLNSEMQIWELQNPPLLSYLKQGSWKEEKFRLNGFGDVTSRGVTVNGVMFWWSYKTVGKDNDDKRLIVSFDLAVEVFTLIPTPQLHDAYGLTMYEEKLAIFSWIEDSKHSVIDLWVMEDGVGLFGEVKLSAFLSGKKVIACTCSDNGVRESRPLLSTVSRHWINIFKTQSFITEHHHHSNYQNPWFLFQRNLKVASSKLCWLDSEMQIHRFQNPPLLDYFKHGRIINSNNGLICVEINRRNRFPHFLLVWNPAIREIRLVPQTNGHEDYYSSFIGFGFCPIIKDYKIVITYASLSYKELSAVKVFSISSGSWKGVEFRLNDTICLSSQSVTANGVMFWLGSKKAGDNTDDDDQDVIVSFDLAMEVFTVIPIPKLYFVPSIDVCEEIALEAQKILLSICGC
ncbi:hypothetical protein K1719_001925 [Acacia pycnantha]|nr:hypothetical protein K1719_001925 [Acacia pycnantha]